MALVTLRMTRAEARQLLSYAKARDRGVDAGWYYGNKKDFERRHTDLLDILARIVESGSTVSEKP